MKKNSFKVAVLATMFTLASCGSEPKSNTEETTSVTEETKDEAPFVYKSIEEILEHIVPTVEVTKIVKPVYNFKASEVQTFK